MMIGMPSRFISSNKIAVPHDLPLPVVPPMKIWRWMMSRWMMSRWMMMENF
jgi:hypothetical protein